VSRKRKPTTAESTDDQPLDPAAARAEAEEAATEESNSKGADPAAAESADEEDSALRQMSRSDFLGMMAAKNEVNAELTRKNSELEAELKKANDKWLRTAAEFENYRKRTRKEWELLKQQSRAEVILEILAIVDDFERAFAAVEDSETTGFVEGFQLIYNNLIQALERMGVQELAALHQPFDPNYHMAVGQIERDDLDVGVVAEVVQKGYTMGDIVIRPANVLVAK
jgi:molecular chaperone GrpE